MNLKEFRFHEEHDWVRMDGAIAVFGITDYAQKTLGDIVYVELPAEETVLTAGEPYAEIESVKAVSDVYAPVSGTVVQVNQEVIDAPELINQSPYEDGWLVRVRLADAAELEALMTIEEYEAMLSQNEE
ncbi:MAG: Glycine cleavage system H protein [Actinobacteria bacterium ADurb.Bin444]|nr:MAG: Glycine cleavage system H protein [Actinobacteria bacterium ADurb.Bin444]